MSQDDDTTTSCTEPRPFNLVTDLPIGDDAPETVHAVTEAQMGTRKKYEYRPEIPGMILDRMLASEVRYPGDYGFIPQTGSGDGDPLDVLILAEETLFPGCILDVRPVGVFRMLDDGETDDKIVGVPADDPRFDHVEKIDDVTAQKRDEIAEFFRTYKNLEADADIEIGGYEPKGKALRMIEEAAREFERTNE
ncbi:inorganic diphosphatase [Halegenticoccus tardaugens]|uniref:inorganic diphosphatase n=1 Tax=Halegenticoccus tardaugens TaxID=2071624 RepID=UPI00100B71AD|nr:inorganic diphosphatase [Halegenticoccus tardaugens]